MHGSQKQIRFVCSKTQRLAKQMLLETIQISAVDALIQQSGDVTSCLVPLPPEMVGKVDIGEASDVEDLNALFCGLDTVLCDPDRAEDVLVVFLQKGTSLDNLQALKAGLLADLADPIDSMMEIYSKALGFFFSNELEKAICLFSLVAVSANGGSPGFTALAACACRQLRFQDGYHLAEKAMLNDGGHPRNHLIAGYCALQLKDFKNARRYLALTTRLARRTPEFRAEQRFAQHELLLLQFS